MVKCYICNKLFMLVTLSHLKHHGLTMQEYRAKFPYAEIQDESLKEKSRIQCTLLHLDPTFGFQFNHTINSNRPSWNKGLTKDTDSRVKQYSESLKGRSLSYDTKLKLSEIRKRYYKEHPEAIPKGEKNGMYGKKLTLKHLKALWTINSAINKPEKEALKVLLQYGFEYVGDRQFWVVFKDKTHKCPDFIHRSGKLAVEIFGDYWHRNDNPKTLIAKYAEIGWDCLVVWEHEVYSTFSPEFVENWLQINLIDEFKLEDFNGNWMQ